jgi:nucleoside-diphosphate-sugar epimerase
VTRVLVTGATGFCGRPLVARLAGAGYAVRAMVRRAPSPPLPAGVEIATHEDLAGPVAWDALLAGVDVVVHLAAIAHISGRTPEETYDRVNHQVTAALARAAAAAGVRHFVFISSVRAQSGATADHVLTERDPPRPSDAYGRSKLAAEAAVAAAGVPFTILRPVLIYGPGLKGNLATLARLATLPLPLGGLTNRRSLLGLDNFIDAVLFVLRTPETRGEIFLIAEPQPLTVAEIVTALRQGRPSRLFSLPPRLVEILARLVGGAPLWERIGGELVIDPAKLLATGWKPSRIVSQASGVSTLSDA